MNRRKSSVASRLLARRAVALKRHIPEAIAGDDHGVHQARVASRRLREAVPVLVADLKGTKSRKTLSKIRQLTKALGTVRELDVTLQLLDELVAAEKLPRPALESVRGRVVSEREERRAVMLKRLEQGQPGKAIGGSKPSMPSCRRRPPRPGAMRSARASSTAPKRSPWRWRRPGTCTRRSSYIKCASRPRSSGMRSSWPRMPVSGPRPHGFAPSSARRTRSAVSTIYRCCRPTLRQSQATPGDQSLPDGGLDVVSRALEDECRHLHARYVAGMPKLADVVEATRKVVVPELAHPRAGNQDDAQSAAGVAARTCASGRSGGFQRYGLNGNAWSSISSATAWPPSAGRNCPDDSKRPLTSEGIARLRKEAKALEGLGVSFDQILSAAHSFERDRPPMFLRRSSKAKPPIANSDALTPAGSPGAVIQELGKHMRKASIALVGHEPNMGELAAFLIGRARRRCPSRRARSAGSIFRCSHPRARASFAGS